MPTSPPTRPLASPLTRARHGGAAILLIAAVPVAIAGLLGQDDDRSVPRSELDYAVRPPDIPAGRMTAIGVVALLLAAAATALLLYGSHRGTADRRRWQVLCPLVAAGVILGLGYHIATAGVIGANIGFGLVVLFGVPLMVVLFLFAAARELVLRVQARRHAPRYADPSLRT